MKQTCSLLQAAPEAGRLSRCELSAAGAHMYLGLMVAVLLLRCDSMGAGPACEMRWFMCHTTQTRAPGVCERPRDGSLFMHWPWQLGCSPLFVSPSCAQSSL